MPPSGTIVAVRVGGFVSSLLEVVFPAPCVCCARALPGGSRALCPECQSRILPLSGARCPTCTGPSDRPDESCLSCAGNTSPIEAAVAWGEYEGVLRDAILALKHNRRDELTQALSGRLAARVALESWSHKLDLVTAVPSHPMHRIRRGYTASALLAADMARLIGRPYRKTLRRHGVARQVGKTRGQRRSLSRSRFSMKARARVAGARVLLVDDVWTTGSTMRLAAQTLRHGGARNVYGAALATAPDARSLA
jgi:ComF family protein